MKLSIPKPDLQRALGRIQAIVERRNSMPILANVLLEAKKEDGGALVVAATDLEVGIRSTQPAKVTKPGALTVSARKLYDIVRELPDEDSDSRRDGELVSRAAAAGARVSPSRALPLRSIRACRSSLRTSSCVCLRRCSR